jgi:hypothetical protein
MIEQELLAEQQLEEAADEKQQIWRIAGVYHIEAARQQHTPRQDERLDESA